MNVATPSSSHLLDNPAWSSLTSRQRHLGSADALAARFMPDIAPFVGMRERTPAAWQALRALIPLGESVISQSVVPLPPIEGMTIEQAGILLQMTATGEPTQHGIENVIRLGASDAPEMLALAQKTRPGPFAIRTHEMGNYIGIRDNGRLIAMAGERMQCDGFVEISAVCVDDAYRGKGIAGELMAILRRQILQRGDTPFLHVFEHNTGAIRLYERLGFAMRQRFFLYRITHDQPVTK